MEPTNSIMHTTLDVMRLIDAADVVVNYRNFNCDVCTVARRRFCCVRRSMVMGASGMYKPKLVRESPHDRPRCFLVEFGLGVLSTLSPPSFSASLEVSSDSCLPPPVCAMLMTARTVVAAFPT